MHRKKVVYVLQSNQGKVEPIQLYTPTALLAGRMLTIVDTDNGSFANGYNVYADGELVVEGVGNSVDLYDYLDSAGSKDITVSAIGSDMAESFKSSDVVYNLHTVTISVTNGDVTGGEDDICDGESITLVFSPIENYQLLLANINVVNASIVSYSPSAKALVINNPIGNVVITANCTEKPTVDPVLANNTWTVIRQVCEVGDAPNYWSLGDTKAESCTDNLTRTMRICDMQGLYGKHVIFEQVESEYGAAIDYWNNSSNKDDENCTNNYSLSDMRTTILPSLLLKYTSELQSQLTNTTYKVAKNGLSQTSEIILELTDKLFLPAGKEIFGQGSYGATRAVTKETEDLIWFKLYESNNSSSFRYKYRVGSSSSLTWYLRSPRKDDSSEVLAVEYGSQSSYPAVRTYVCYAPCFSF